jgi:predicted histone-like DNA-binding protein
MTVKVKAVTYSNPQNRSQTNWHYRQVLQDTVDIEEIARAIEDRSSSTYADVLAVLMNLTQVIPTYLKMGQSVHLRDFGSFRLVVTSEGKPAQEELSVQHIKGGRIVFTPATKLEDSVSKLFITKS